MPRRSSRDADLVAVADSQLGLITAAQLAQLGVQTSTVARRRAGGMWTRVLPGVHLVDGGHPTRTQRLLAALLYAGPDSMLTGTSALRLYGFRALHLQEIADDEPERPEPVHVLVAHERRRLSTGFVRIERTHRLPTPARRRGLAVAPLARAVGDAARRFPRESDAVAVVTEAVQRGWVDVDDLRTELREGPTRGSRYLRGAVASVARGARSVPEVDLASLLEAAQIPGLVLNARLVTDSGVFVAVADAWLDDVGLAIEVDSLEYHSTGEHFERTVRRNARYATAGVPVFTVLPTDIRDRPNSVVGDVLSARAAATQRPRPRVHVTEPGTASAGRLEWPWGA
jgi:hypothetical protein